MPARSTGPVEGDTLYNANVGTDSGQHHGSTNDQVAEGLDCIIILMDPGQTALRQRILDTALTRLERAELEARFVRNAERIGQLVQQSGPGRHEALLKSCAKQLAKTPRSIQAVRKRLDRSLKLEPLTAKVREHLREHGLDQNQSAMTAIAANSTEEGQLAALADLLVVRETTRKSAQWIIYSVSGDKTGDDLEPMQTKLYEFCKIHGLKAKKFALNGSTS